MNLSERITRMAPSATTTMAARAKELKAQGKPVVSFTAGEPDFDSPEAARHWAAKAMEEGQTHYTVNAGTLELREAIAGYYDRHFGLTYNPKTEVITGTGAKQILYEALGCLVNPGDEVILFTPAWVSYYEQIRLFDGVPVTLDTKVTNFLPVPEEFEKRITDRTAAVILNNPTNPTGVVYPAGLLEQITRIALKHGITLINDEIYERLVYGTPTPHPLKLVPEARGLVLNVNGVSKSYAMTGWRLGYALGPEKLIKAMTSLQGHITSGASSISQWAAAGAINESEADVERMRQAFERRRDLVVGLLSDIPGLTLVKPGGAFYVFADISHFLGKRWADDVAFCEAILMEKGLGLVPGSAFLCPGHIRLSYSCSEDQIVEGVRRLKEFLAS